jgi:hypothetical protein
VLSALGLDWLRRTFQTALQFVERRAGCPELPHFVELLVEGEDLLQQRGRHQLARFLGAACREPFELQEVLDP